MELASAAPETPEHVWSDWIEPANLVSLVRNTAPFLFEGKTTAKVSRLAPLAERPFGFLDILLSAENHGWTDLAFEEKLEDYFTLCLASHHATVATFVPTDVDSKIRGLIFRRARDPQLVRRLAAIALAMRQWDLTGLSQRNAYSASLGQTLSGHDGEWLSVAAGAHGRLLQLGASEKEEADHIADAIDAELRRELEFFDRTVSEPGQELEAIKAAMVIAHNVGDLDQGISFWDTRDFTLPSRQRFARLAHENVESYGGRFRIPTDLYRKSVSAEGHRHYPLRGVKALRVSADLLLPMGPFFDDWGAVIGTHPVLDTASRAEVLEALVRGCRKVPNQHGYFRAIAGFQNASQRNFDAAVDRLPSAAKRELRDPAMRQQIAVPRGSFESRYRKMVAALRR